MKTRLLQSSLFMLLMLIITASFTFAQDAASVTWNLIGADSLSPTTTVGNVTGQMVTNSDTIAIIDMKSIPNSPISGETNALRWAPYVDGAKVSWGNETMQNDNRWIQFALAPNTGNIFAADSISIYLGASGTTDHIRANLYYSTDPTFADKTLLNPSMEGVLPYRDSLQHFGYHLGALVNEGDTLYFRVYPWYDGSPSTSKYLFTQYAQIFGKTIPPTISIDSARKAVDSTVTIVGVTISPNFQTSGRSYYIWDGTGGIVTYKSGLSSPDLKMGDLVMVTGKISPFNGLLEIIPASDTNIVVLGGNAPLPKPEVVSISDFNTNGEMYESHLVEIKNLTLLSGTWPTSGPSKSIYLTDGKDTVNVFLDSDMKLYNSPEPKWPVDLVGIGSQYSTTGVGGYEVLPRFITDFMSHVISIDSARTITPDMDTVMITGVTISPNFQTVNRSYYIWDGTGGIVTYKGGLNSPALKLGDSVMITGTTHIYNGLLEFQPLTDTSLVVLDSNAVLPQPEEVSISEFNTNGEMYESHLIEIKGLSLADGTWPTSGNATLHLNNGTDTVVAYLDSDMKLFDSPEPIWPVDLIGIGSQYSSTGVGGYQILPRFISDFMEVTQVPVELTSFSAKIVEGKVMLTWQTATEINNSGFEIQRSADGKNFVKIGFVNGHGSTVEKNSYSFSDKFQSAGIYYRLKQIDYDGSFKYSDVVQVTSMVPKEFSLKQNYPNPFNPTTVISYDLPVDSKVVLKVYDILGNEVATLVNGEEAAGTYNIIFGAQNMNHRQLSSGIYFYKLETGKYTAIKKMMLLK
jgi:DNA/RNA endonuclease YhcR with UshA esterase domain